MPTHRPRPFPPPLDATALLQAAPTPLLHVNAQQQLCWANPAAQLLWGATLQPGQALQSLWPDAAAALCTRAAVQAELGLHGAAQGRVLASGQPLAGGGWLLTLPPQPAAHNPGPDAVAKTRTHAAADPAQFESQLALAVDMASIGLWRHDLRTGRVHYNPQARRILGLAPDVEWLPSAQVRSLVHPDDMPGLRAARRAALTDDAALDMEARFRRSDGAWRLVMTRRVLQRGPDGQALAYVGVSLDVTDHASLTHRAAEMTRRFELVTRTAGIGWWVSEDSATPATWSAQLRQIFGLSGSAPVPMLREWLDTCAHPDDREMVRREFSLLMQRKEVTKELGFRIVRSDGEVRHLYTHSRHEPGPQGSAYFGVVVDLTEQRRAEAALKGAAERAALAARGAGVGTWEMDSHSNEMRWDAQMWVLRGLQPGPRRLNYEERLACVHPDDRQSVKQHLQPALAAGLSVNQEFRVVWPDGSVRWLASRSVELEDDGTGRRRRIGVNWDITDSRTADIVRQERAMALRENESKSKFLARMSHELRTPLTAVLGFTQLLLQEDKGSSRVATARRKRLEYIHSAGQHLHNLINDVLDLSSLQGGELRIALQPVALAPVVAATLPLLGPLLNSRQVSVQCGALDTTVMADATRLRQVLLNLLSNAVKYNRHDGQVHIEAMPCGAEVLLRVTDTGRGMSEQQLRHIFEPFNRLGVDGGAIEGTGIGLAIVKTLVERMGGSVHVDSTLGQGSVFEVRLRAGELVLEPPPAAPAAGPTPPPAAALPATAPSPLRTRRHQVLYVEDNPVNALIIGELLARRHDLQVHVAVDGASGVAQALAIKPDLILLDMQLPDCDGFEVLRRLRAEPATAAIPCIALSANAIPEEIERALSAGLSDYWTKPLDFKAFMASLDALFGKAP